MSKRYRINYVAHIDPYAHTGGGEIVLRALLDAGARLGHDIRRTCAWPRRLDERVARPDFWLLADVYNMPHSRWRRLPSRLIRDVVDAGRYIHFDNAYVDVCDLDYLPCNGDATGDHCPFKRPGLWRDTRCCRHAARRLYERAVLNIFVSPLHRQTVQRLVGSDAVPRYLEMRPVVDTDRFRDTGGARSIGYLYLGHVNEAKGAENLARAFPGGDLVLAGAVPEPRWRSLGRHLGPVPHDEVPALLNRARVLVHLPRWPEPQGRAVAEAALCGCQVMTNDRVGATSFGLDLADPKTYEGAVDEAWAAIARAIDQGTV